MLRMPTMLSHLTIPCPSYRGTEEDAMRSEGIYWFPAREGVTETIRMKHREEGECRDDDVDIEVDEDEEEEHPAPANSVVVALPATDHAPSAEETDPMVDAEISALLHMDRGDMHDRREMLDSGITTYGYVIVETLRRYVSTCTELDDICAFKTRVRQDTDEIYTRLDDEQSQRQLLAGRLNMLFRDRRAHAYTRHLMETEARLSQEAWRRSMDASGLAHGEVMSLRTTVLGQMSEIKELHAADRRRQAVTSKMLKADHRRSA
ncbi:hypothetical protein Tco_1494002 [Tanacetum coccineum]